MKQFTLKINSRLSGIKDSSVSVQDGSDDRRFDLDDRNESSAVADAIRIRQLNGRIKILELELQKAREESFKVGFEEGRRSSFQGAQKNVDAMRIEMQSMELKYLETIEEIETPLLDLAKRMAREVISVELLNREDLDAILFERLRKMLYEVVEQNKIVIGVNPNQMDEVKKANIKEEMNLPDTTDVNFIAQPDLNKGEAQIKSEDYFIDGSFDEQLQQVHDELKNKDHK